MVPYFYFDFSNFRDFVVRPASRSDLHCSIGGAAMCALPAQALSCVQLRAASRQSYVPNFKKAFERFLLHTGGRGVIESIQEGLSLSSKDCQASFDTLYRFGNTSAASTWCARAH